MTTHKKLTALLAGTALALVTAGQAWADGTLAGSSIDNTATVDYAVGGVNQPDITSNTASFLVDRRVNLTVAELGGAATPVAPGSTSQVTTFTVTNTTNSTQDFRLVAAQDANGATTAFSDTDSFDATNVRVFVDSNGNGVYDPGVDTQTFIDELAPDSTVTVFVVVDVPLGQPHDATAGVSLTAIAADAGTGGSLGADMTQTAGADTPGSVDTVFGDAAGDSDAARDGRFSDDDEYDVLSATITLIKTSRVISDPFNGTVNPKAIPGAVLEYCIQVQNTGGAAANGVAINDPLPANTTFVPGSIVAGGTVTGGVCNADGTAEDDNAAGADETDPNGGSFNAGVVSATAPSVSAGSTSATRFRVTVN